MFIVALFTVSMEHIQPICPLSNDLITQNMVYSSNGVIFICKEKMICSKYVVLKSILSEITQVQKDEYSIVSVI